VQHGDAQAARQSEISDRLVGDSRVSWVVRVPLVRVPLVSRWCPCPAASCDVDRHGRIFGHVNLLVCDGSILLANPGVNPSLTITALSEHVMSAVPSAA
jgi:hypothetical protein